MHNLNSKEKRQARITALQAIYAQEFSGSDQNTTFKYMLDPENIPGENVITYSRHLFALTMTHISETDELIKNRSKNWAIERITILDRLILRMSLAEMLYEDEVPS